MEQRADTVGGAEERGQGIERQIRLPFYEQQQRGDLVERPTSDVEESNVVEPRPSPIALGDVAGDGDDGFADLRSDAESLVGRQGGCGPQDKYGEIHGLLPGLEIAISGQERHVLT
jgi:hypothetical protein